jgi:hypothetical protein
MIKLIAGLAVFAAVLTGVARAANVGPPADVAAVRAAVHQKFPTTHILGLHVVGDYALIDWYEGEASGYGAFKRVAGKHWKELDWGGGADDVNGLVKSGIPASIARKLCSGWGDTSPC